MKAVPVVAILVTLAAPQLGRARECPNGCTAQKKACVRTARIEAMACRQTCRASLAAGGPAACTRACAGALQTAVANCAGDRTRCVAACSPPPPPATCDPALVETCGHKLGACAKGVIGETKACRDNCRAAGAPGDCFEACAAKAEEDVAVCAKAFAGCVAPCRPTTTTTTLPGSGCTADADCDDGNGCSVDRCVDGTCQHVCICFAAAASTCCPGPSALCVRPCGAEATGACGGFCPGGASCEASAPAAACGCVSGPGGPCGGNILNPRVTCAPGLVCRQSNPDVTGVCVERTGCIPLFQPGCTQTSDCCDPCGNGRIAPCGVCIRGTCEGAP